MSVDGEGVFDREMGVLLGNLQLISEGFCFSISYHDKALNILRA